LRSDYLRDSQNVYLQAVPFQLGTVVIGAFQDEEVKKMFKMTDREMPLYIMRGEEIIIGGRQ
jgi:nitroreductase